MIGYLLIALVAIVALLGGCLVAASERIHEAEAAAARWHRRALAAEDEATRLRRIVARPYLAPERGTHLQLVGPAEGDGPSRPDPSGGGDAA